MRRLAILLAFFATSAFAQEFELGTRYLVVTTSSTDDLDVPESRGFAATAEMFVTPRVSTELSISFVNPQATFRDQIDLGTLGLQTIALTGRWNLASDARLSAFAGAGVALVTIGNLDDQLGDDIEAEFDRATAFVVEGGLRLRLRRMPRLASTVTLSYMPLTVEPNVRRSNVALPTELSLNPLTLGFGATWRF